MRSHRVWRGTSVGAGLLLALGLGASGPSVQANEAVVSAPPTCSADAINSAIDRDPQTSIALQLQCLKGQEARAVVHFRLARAYAATAQYAAARASLDRAKRIDATGRFLHEPERLARLDALIETGLRAAAAAAPAVAEAPAKTPVPVSPPVVAASAGTAVQPVPAAQASVAPVSAPVAPVPWAAVVWTVQPLWWLGVLLLAIGSLVALLTWRRVRQVYRPLPSAAVLTSRGRNEALRAAGFRADLPR